MTVRITVTIPDDVHDALEDQSAQDQRTMSATMVDLVRRGLSEIQWVPMPWNDAVAIARDEIRAGKTDHEALTVARETYPSIRLKTVAWVRWDLRIGRNEDVGSDREARARRDHASI